MKDTKTWTFLTASVESRRAVPELADLIDREQPEVINMSQAYNIADWAQRIEGYQFRQPRMFLNREAHCVGVLIREDVSVEKKLPLRMQEEWIGAKVAQRHKPRVYPRYVLRREETAFNYIGVHLPTHNDKQAQAESFRRLNNFARNHPGRPNIVLGDFNEEADELAEVLPLYRVTQGTKVDHIATTGALTVPVKKRYTVPEGLHGFVSFTYTI